MREAVLLLEQARVNLLQCINRDATDFTDSEFAPQPEKADCLVYDENFFKSSAARLTKTSHHSNDRNCYLQGEAC